MLTMHSLFTQVLVQKNLSKAGDLFSLEDDYVINDFSAAIKTIQNIITQPEFLTNHNDQSLVEICITRLTSAIRETRTIEQHAVDLVALLENCLSYNLRPVANKGGLDPPHAKIAGDVMSCIFLNYSKHNVMQLSLPVAVKFLHKGNKDLSRNMSSYLSLAAIENAELLAQHIQPIIDSVISGNYSLARVLPTIYAVDDRGDPINNHVMTLVSILPNCENTEKLALLSLFGLIAKDNPLLLEPSVPQLCESLTSQSTALATLQVFYHISLSKPHILADHVDQIRTTAENFPKAAMYAVQVMCAVAKVRPEKSEETMDFILSTVCRMESEKHSIILKEMVALVSKCPSLLTANVINRISSLEEGASSAARSYIQELKNEYNSRASKDQTSLGDVGTSQASAVTVVRVGGSRSELSSSKPHLYQQMTPTKVENRMVGQSTSGSRTKLDKSGARLASSHRSMTKLNLPASGGVSVGSGGVVTAAAAATAAGGSSVVGAVPGAQVPSGFDSRLGLHKSMTRLNAASHQNMARFNSSGQVMPLMSAAPTSGATAMSGHHGSNVYSTHMMQPGVGGGHHHHVARSVTCISGAGGRPTSSVLSSYGPKVTVSTGPGASSPTKSMSSGSMSGVAVGPEGRGVVTVNVNQINQDLIRQVSSVLSQHGGDINGLPLPAATGGPQLPNPAGDRLSHPHISGPAERHGPFSGNSAAAAASAPFSLPSQASRRVAPYSSGPLPTLSASQPPSLGLPTAASGGAAGTAGAAGVSGASALPQHPPAPQVPPTSSQNLHDPPLTSTRGGRLFSSSTLPSPRRRAAIEKREAAAAAAAAPNGGDQNGGEAKDFAGPLSGSVDGVIARAAAAGAGGQSGNNRMSVFEPYPMRDTVQHFCEKHLTKIKQYMTSLMVKLPLPVKCTIEERKGRKHAKLHFACQGREGDHCLYKATFYAMKTRNPKTWIHLMFLALQAQSSSAISTREASVSALKNCWEILKFENISFVTLVTGAFPPAKDQDTLLHELRGHRFFDVFEYNGPRQHWGCFLCNHPDRAVDFLQESEPVIAGQLKEKRGGKWNIFKKWKSRYFTLSGAKLTYQENGDSGVTQSLDVGSIRSVKVSKEGRRSIPKAFEIFTNDRTFILKAKDSSNAQEWVQCLSVAKAHSEARDTNLRKLAYGGSLGRLNHHGRSALAQRASLANSNIALRTAV